MPLVPTIVEPADKSTVEELSTVTLTVDCDVVTLLAIGEDADPFITVTNKATGEEVDVTATVDDLDYEITITDEKHAEGSITFLYNGQPVGNVQATLTAEYVEDTTGYSTKLTLVEPDTASGTDSKETNLLQMIASLPLPVRIAAGSVAGAVLLLIIFSVIIVRRRAVRRRRRHRGSARRRQRVYMRQKTKRDR